MTIRQKTPTRRRDLRSVSANKLAGILAVVFATLSATPADADSLRFGDTLTFSVGAMNHTGDGYVVSTRPDLPFDKLTFRDLNLNDDEDIVWFNLNWQFSSRWQLGLSYSSFDSEGLAIASTGGNYDGVEWVAGAVLATRLDVEFVIADVYYDFLQTEKGRLGVGLGVHTADMDFNLQVGVFSSVDGGEVEFVPVAFDESSFLAPLPNLSLVGGYRVAENVYVEGRAGWLSLSYDNYEGDLLSLRFSAEWRPWKTVGIGVGYQFVDVDVDRDGSRGTDTYDLEFDGPIVFLSAGF